MTAWRFTSLRSLPPATEHGRQRGAALVTGLVILLVMTIIGITALNTTKMENQMARNLQDATRAFETGETGLVAAMADPDWAIQSDTTDGLTGIGDYDGAYDYTRQFRDFFALKRTPNQVFSAVRFRRAQFAVTSDARLDPGTGARARTVLHAGVYLIVPNPGAQ